MEIRRSLQMDGASKASHISRAKKSGAGKAKEAKGAEIKTGDSVSISAGKSAVKETKPAQETKAPVRAESVKPEPSLKPENLKAMPKDLYKVHRDGSTKKVRFIYDAEGRKNIDNLTLIGSWDKNTGKWSNEWKNSAVKMQMDEKGRWIADLQLDADSSKQFRWGVLADSPIGKQTWAIFEETDLPLDMSGEKPVAEYAPTTYTRMGATRDKDNVNFKFWSPHARDIKVKMWDKDPDKAEYLQLKKDPKTNMWSGGIEGGWEKADGKIYAFEIVTSEGKKVLKNDPYARYLQGQQRGIGEIYLHPKTGMEVHKFYKDPSLEQQGKRSWKRMLRFEVQGHGDANAVYLTFKDENGKPMDKKALMERLGDHDKNLVHKFHKGEFSDHWSDNVDDKGRVKLVQQGNAWASIFNSPGALPGLEYQFEIHKTDANGKEFIVGDANKDGALSAAEARKTAFNDPYSGKISEEIGWQRFGIIKEPDKFEWKNDNVPRMAKSHEKAVIYQLHVGSVFGDAKNVQRSTFKDVIKGLKYFKDLGVNTLEIMPSNTYEGKRDWGYIGTSSFAMSDNYGFVDDDGSWVGGTDALKRFIDAAHGEGFNVINDVVYNHWGGDYNNMWQLDGLKNPAFDWEENPQVTMENQGGSLFKNAKPTGIQGSDVRGKVEKGTYEAYRNEEKLAKSQGKTNDVFKKVRHTDWGAMPAFNKEAISQFIVDHAMAQVEEFRFDGLRFDFTHPIHNQNWGGGDDGWKLLRKINRQIHYFNPDVKTAAEEFPKNEIMTRPAAPNMKGGAGFDQMWNTEYQHRLVHDHSNPSILQQAVKGWKTDMDKFMNHLVFRPGFTSNMNSVTVISNHDEVGNADRTINVAMNHTKDLPHQWARNAIRMTFGTGMLSPGTPIFFQGEESMATNNFSWGRPSTWDVGWDWQNNDAGINWNEVKMDDSKANMFMELSNEPVENRSNRSEFKALSETDRKVLDHLSAMKPEERQEGIRNIFRRQHNQYVKDVINLRKSSPAFDGDADVYGVYTHNDNSVMAFSRKKEGEEFLVIGSLNKHNLHNYNIPLSDGKWKLVFNSDADFYGGENFGSRFEVDGNQGSTFDIPKGGMLVYKRV